MSMHLGVLDKETLSLHTFSFLYISLKKVYKLKEDRKYHYKNKDQPKS